MVLDEVERSSQKVGSAAGGLTGAAEIGPASGLKFAAVGLLDWFKVMGGVLENNVEMKLKLERLLN
ncbi:MAG TPA: hypothetical protein VGL57_06810 [Solirubrobacteraceae bacterium]